MAIGIRASSVAFVLMGVSATACSALFGYPEKTAESSAALCSDGTDNDYDGAIDCDDAECDGFCPEQDIRACEDGRDNDGDGLVDQQDPRCWLVHAPAVTRCASRAPTVQWERFDAFLSAGRWTAFDRGSGASPAVEIQSPILRDQSPNRVLGFASTEADVQGGIISTHVFDGDWNAFELSFALRPVEGAFLQVALVPASLAPDGAPPVDGWDSAAVVVELDASLSTIALRAGGRQASIPVDLTGVWHRLRLSAAGDELVLALDESEEARIQRPALSPSRLVVFGQARVWEDSMGSVQIDDLRLSLNGNRPCDVASPQIPFGNDCRTAASKRATDAGYSTAVAGSPTAGNCALIAAGLTDNPAPTHVESWMSDDGRTWSLGGSISTGRELVGAGLAWDPADQLFHGVLAEAGSGVRLLTSTSPDCTAWTEPEEASVLPSHAEAPSYVVESDGTHVIYFTRPPTGSSGRSLWRLGSDAGGTFEVEAEQVSVFDPSLQVNAPVSIALVGEVDLIATYPTLPGSGADGLGLLIAMKEASDFQPLSLWPLLAPAGVQGGFDAEEIVSGSLLARPGGGILLYGARGQPFPDHASSNTQLTVGTAEMSLDGTAPSASSVAAGAVCGDATCQPEESCAGCPIDCGVCDGKVLVSDDFTSAGAWQLVSPVEDAAPSNYVADDGVLLLEPSRAAWMSRTVSELIGDFELSFDIHVVGADPASTSTCSAYVGVGRAPSPWTMDPQGVFLQVDQARPCSAAGPVFSPRVRTGRTRIASSLAAESEPPCTGAVAGLPEAWHHVLLRRESGRVSVEVQGPDGCAWQNDGTAAVDYVGPLAGLDTVLIGWGGRFEEDGWQSPCEEGSAAIAIDNLVLRNLPCREGGADCGEAGCFDLAESPENCSACGRSVESAEVCDFGAPACKGTLCPDPESGTDVCVDLQEDPAHCGACGEKLEPLEWCVHGLRQASMVAIPAGFWIDSTEVTRAQYAAWLATDPSTDDQPLKCLWNHSFAPGCAWPPEGRDQFPVRCVDWCDANAYCKSIGKHLCGLIGGGATATGNAETEQWPNACSSGGLHAYPYGDELDPSACHLPFAEEAHEVGALPGCQSNEQAYAGVFDMNGNVSEWLVYCFEFSSGGTSDTCFFASSAPDATCTSTNQAVRASSNIDKGFRCCAL